MLARGTRRPGPDTIDVGDLGVLTRPYFQDDRHDAVGGVAAVIADRPEGGQHGRGALRWPAPSACGLRDAVIRPS